MNNLLRIALLVFPLGLPQLAVGQSTTSAAVARAVQSSAGNGKGMSLLQHIERGGPLVYLLGAISVVCVLMILVCMFTIRRGVITSDSFMERAETLLDKGDHNGLLKLCQSKGIAVATITGTAVEFMLSTSQAIIAELREVAQAEGSKIAGVLTQRISYLSDIASIAPMVGLLGTVMGMIKSFESISDGSFATARQMQLATGVSEALVNTAGGLVICIPAMMAYAMFRGKVQRLISIMEADSTQLLAKIAADFPRDVRARRGVMDGPADMPRESDGGYRYREGSPDRP